ncbi:MAG: hypothetical protein RLZZ184_4039, partial [Cyanobacteriota bacterium]
MESMKIKTHIGNDKMMKKQAGFYFLIELDDWNFFLFMSALCLNGSDNWRLNEPFDPPDESCVESTHE